MMLSNAALNIDPRTTVNSQVRREKQPQRSHFSICQAPRKTDLISEVERAIYFQPLKQQPQVYQDIVTPLNYFARVLGIKELEGSTVQPAYAFKSMAQ